MPLDITSEQYNGGQGLYANAGDWIDGEATFRTRFSVGSSATNKFNYNNFGGDYQLTLPQGNAQDWGFVAGDSIILEYNMYIGAVAIPQTFNTTVLYTTGSSIFIADEFTFNLGVVTPHINGRKFPTDDYTSSLLIRAVKAPESVQFWFNLTPNGSQLLESMIDSELNRFELPVVTGIPTGIPQAMTQLLSYSGGLIKDVDLTLVATLGGSWRQYRVRYKFMQWGVIKDGFTEPNYYDNADCLAPVFRIQAFSQYGNPNGVLTDTSDNTESNTGGFNENHNGAVNLYTATGITWQDALGDTIQALDNSGISTFEATVEAPNQSNPNSTYRLGLLWRPVDGSYYQNIQQWNLGNNLLVLAPEVDFIADGVNIGGPFLGEENEDGARWDLANVTISLAGTTLTITGMIIPNAQATILFAGVPDGGRLSTLWLSLGDITLDGTPNSKRVSLQLFNDDNIDAPTLGVQIPDVIDEVLIDHGLNDITLPLPQTTTEDDVLYRSNFRLIDGITYEGVRAEIMAFNTTTEEQFTLEDIFFSFNSVPFITGQFQPNFIQQRGFNLPPLSDRNHISLTREPSLDIAGKYALKLEYGYLSRWEYWLEQANVNNDFFDILQYAFNGKNKNWQRFSNSGDWIVRLAYYTRLNGVDNFNYQEVGIRPYENDADVSTTWGIEVLSNNTFPTNLVDNELHELTATLIWGAGAYTNAWAEITIEDFEAGNRWVISSVLAQGGIVNNPLQPIVGQTMLDLQLPAVNIAVLKTYLDTNIISANKVCVSARIYSEDVPIPPEWEWVIYADKQAERGYSYSRKLSPDSVYAGALCRVRRSLDNTELDIPYIQIGVEYVLDEAILLGFTGNQTGDFGWIVTRYDQAGGLNHATNTNMSAQANIVHDGVVVYSANGRVGADYDGIGMWYLMNGLSQQTETLASSIFDRTPVMGPVGTAASSVGFGRDIAPSAFGQVPAPFSWNHNNLIYDFLAHLGNPLNSHFVGQSQQGKQFIIVWRDVTQDIRMRLNGVNGSTINDFIITELQYNCLDRSKNNYNRGIKCEDIIWMRDRPLDRTPSWIENNANLFYNNIY